MSVTAPNTTEVEHFGGPFDGYFQAVPVDSDGNPPEFYTVDVIGAGDPSIDPSTGPTAQIATQFYEREMRVGGDGPRWVFVWHGEHMIDAAEAA